MSVLSDLEPKKVFHYFEEICRIPHGSGNVKQISDYLVLFAKQRNLKFRQDEKYNVIIWKDASKGYENSAPVILQGHMDMVAVKDEGIVKDMETEGLDLQISKDLISARGASFGKEMISAKGTSLGGDDGIALAYCLAILDDDLIPHPPLEAVFTVDEEIGMLGADALDVSDLKGKMLLNIDSEDEGIFTVSCAGGATVNCHLPYRKEPTSGTVIELRMDGFAGGHSGTEIDKGRVNANCAMGRVLLNVFQRMGMRLMTIAGGEKDNAIANFCEAAMVVLPEMEKTAKEIIESTFDEIKEEYQTTDPEMKLTLNVIENQVADSFSDASTLAVVIALINMPNGIQRMNPDMEGMVQTSLNLGILRTETERVSLTFAVRSSVESEKMFLIEKLRSLTEIFGGEVTVNGAYPGWEYQKESRLREVAVEAYQELNGDKPVVEGIHAGLECGIFASKIPGLDALSLGPQMENVHTTEERLSISSTGRTWELILKILEKLR